MKRTLYIFVLILSLSVLMQCTNPFAPRLLDNSDMLSATGDQRTVEGLFQNFSYAYQYKDTLIYGKLFADDFTFIFRDHEKGIDKTWGRAEEMYIANNMFQNIVSAELLWNASSQQVGDSLLLDVSRAFSLKLEINPADVINVYGRAVLRMKRQSTEDEWKIISWRDESTY